MKKQKLLIPLLAVLVLLFFLNITGLGARARDKVLQLIAPTASREWNFINDSRRFGNNLFNFQKIAKQNETLREQLLNAEQELIKTRLENEDLKRLTRSEKYAENKGLSLIPARVFAKTPGDNFLAFIIDKGRAEGVSENQIVMTETGVLAGKIIKVGEHYSVFRFITDEASRFTAAISGETSAIGEARGRLGVSLNLEFVPRDAGLEPGDLIVTAGLEDGVPEGLLLGRVVEVFSDEVSPLSRALLQPAANLNNLRVVSVIKTASFQ